MLAFFFILLCTQFLSNLALQSHEEKDTRHTPSSSGNDVKHDELVLSKASKGKGSFGGQNDQPPSTKKSRGVSILSKPPAYISNTGIGVLVIYTILVFDL
ncbi:hypothetical protein L2E82_27479 [Cichorium intybus]|uniref:Uncharacterized protein n=1 Tax=Cichorium intybus TaxID=13427 RepID=A0ACB9CT78_CICIN|nr:hypothetical protein L2E82_27479 [Cichorium intybus]